MNGLSPELLHVYYLHQSTSIGMALPRRYTLTHSDATGELFLGIGFDYDRHAISKIYTRLMRDEVLAEYFSDDAKPELHVYCHVSGGLVFGSAGWRFRIFHHHMPQVLQAFRYGDADFFREFPNFDTSRVIIHFNSANKHYQCIEEWGTIADYQIKT